MGFAAFFFVAVVACSCSTALAVDLAPSEKAKSILRIANWSGLLSEPASFVLKSHVRLRNRPEGYQPGARCAKFVGMAYLDNILDSKQTVCGPRLQSADALRPKGARRVRHRRELAQETSLPPSESSVDCYTAPHTQVGYSSKAAVSLCRSRNLVLNSCAFFGGRRRGTLTKKFPLPTSGAVQLACELANTTKLAAEDKELQWLSSVHSDVWWANATRDNDAVQKACAPGSPSLVTTPTLFVMRDRHANYAHEIEVVSMAFSFLAALEPQDVAAQGVQVVIVDQAPPTGFLETWARISAPHRLRLLAQEPFPPGTCFASAYHVYTFAAGIGYNINAETTRCESPVITGFSHWLRQLYKEPDPAGPPEMSAPAVAASIAGPVVAAAGVRGLRPPTSGLVVKNVVWLSRRNLEMVRLLLNASVGWKAMRMVRNEAEVVAGLVAAVQEWNAESCLLRRFDRVVEAEYQKSLSEVNPVHRGQAPIVSTGVPDARHRRRRRLSAVTGGGPDIDEHGNDGDDEDDSAATFDGDGDGGGDVVAAAGDGGGAAAAGQQPVGSTAASNRTSPAKARPPYLLGDNIVLLDKLWEIDEASGEKCRKTNVLFKFVDGDFNDMSYHQQVKLMFGTGVLAGVHGAGLTHGFFLPPGQSAVLQLLGDTFAKVAANNVFRNMAVGVGNYYEDVYYEGSDVEVGNLKAAVKRAMDFVARTVMEARQRHNGPPRLVLDDQTHFSLVTPPPEQCPRSATHRR